jgi:hypothetical protein
MAKDATLLLCVVGSTVHGLAVQDGVEDLDVTGDLLTSSPLPEQPDVSRVEAFVLRAYRTRWGW